MAATLTITLVENSYDLAANTSSVTATVKIQATNSWNLISPSGQITFGGNASGSYSFTHTFDKYTTTTLYTRTFTVNHNADGTGQVTASAYFDTGVSPGRITASATLNLTRLARASTISVSGTLTVGEASKIHITSQISHTYVHDITWSCAGETGNVVLGVFGNSDVNFTPPSWLASDITSGTSATMTLTCKTKLSTTGALIGTTSITVQVRLPTGLDPTISSVALSDTKGYATKYGAYVVGESSLRAVISAQLKNGASASEYAVNVVNDGQKTSTSSTVTYGAVKNAGNLTVKCRVKDSRGLYGYYYSYIKAVEYTYPTLEGTTISRWSTSQNKEDDESTTVRVSVKGSICNVNNMGTHTATVVIRYKLKGSSSWTTANTRTVGTTFSYVQYIYNMPNTNQYDIEVELTDGFGHGALMRNGVSTATPVMDFRADGMGIAMWRVSEHDGLEIDGDVSVGNGRTLYSYYPSSTEQLPLLKFSGQPEFLCPSIITGDISFMYQMGVPWLMYDYDTGLSLSGANGLSLNWPSSKSIGGNVRKTLWTGDCAHDAVITVPGNMAYNVFLLTLWTDKTKVIAVRENKDGAGSRISGIGGVAKTSRDGQWVHAVYFQAQSATQWKLVASNTQGHDNSAGHAGTVAYGITKIEGLI